MKRPTYRAAVAWIALNDAPADQEPASALVGYLTVLLVADLFGRPEFLVADDVLRYRARQPGGKPYPPREGSE